MTVLTGAAVGSAIGAWENLPVWDYTMELPPLFLTSALADYP